MVKGNRWPSFAPVKHHAHDFDSEFNDPAIWNSASYTAHPIDDLEPMPDASNDYRKAAIEHLQILKAIDLFMTCTPDARLGWVSISIVLRLTSVRGLSNDAIANQLGVTEAAVSRSTAKFMRLVGLDRKQVLHLER
jgi:hypothetical protein